MNGEPCAAPNHVEVMSPDTFIPFDGAHWYDLAGPTHFWMRWRLAEALRLVDQLGIDTAAPLRALDVGGGIGVVRGQLEGATGWTVDVGELDATALRQSTPGRGRTLHYDILQREAEFEAAYDLIVLFDVLEHIDATTEFVDALLWHLRPGGHLLINVPALPRGHSRYDEAAGHVRRYTRATLSAELPPDRTEILGVRYWGMGLVPMLFARKAWLGTVGRNQSRDHTLQSGFRSPGPVGSGLVSLLMRSEQRILDPSPLGTSLLLGARRRS